MEYRYFAWKEGSGHWGGQKLLSSDQIRVLRSHLPSHYEQFETVQKYTACGKAVECPIYADFDHATLETARKDAVAFTQAIIYHLNVIPEIFFSGNKGFHVIVPYELRHPRCHLVAKGIAAELGGELRTLDPSVYRNQSLLRLPNTPASKPGQFKVPLTRDQLFKDSEAQILAFARRPQAPAKPEFDLEKINSDYLEEIFHRIAAGLSSEDYTPRSGGLTLTPCLQTLLKDGAPEGQRNHSVFILAKYFKSIDMPLKDTLNILLAQPHFADWNARREVKVESVVSSVYRSRRVPTIGCKASLDADILRSYCSDMCIFSDSFPDLNIRGSRAKAQTGRTPPKA